MATSAEFDLQQHGAEFAEAIKFYRQLIKERPTDSTIFGHLHGSLLTLCDWEDYEDRLKKLSCLLDKQLQSNLLPFGLMDAHGIVRNLKAPVSSLIALSLQQQLDVAVYYSTQTQLLMDIQKSTTPALQYHLSSKRLRVGYIFGFDSKLLKVPCPHDKENFEVFYYRYHRAVGCFPQSQPDHKSSAEHIVDLTKLEDNKAAAKRIAADFIQILVNLDESPEENDQLNEILALRPAPIQAVYRTSHGTTGATYMDYIITDKVASPLQFAYGYSEKLAYMPNGMFVWDAPARLDKPMNPEQTEQFRQISHLPLSAVVFGVRSDSFMIDPDTFESWCEILRNVPKSVLWLMIPHYDQTKVNLRQEAERHKIDPNRLIFVEGLMAKLDCSVFETLVDVILDTPVFNAKGMIKSIVRGVPVLTMPRESFMSRLTASLLTSINYEELIVKSKSEYVEMAVTLGNNSERLTELRAKLSEILPNSNLFRVDQYFNDLENLYQKMWERKEMGENPEHIE